MGPGQDQVEASAPDADSAWGDEAEYLVMLADGAFEVEAPSPFDGLGLGRASGVLVA